MKVYRWENEPFFFSPPFSLPLILMSLCGVDRVCVWCKRDMKHQQHDRTRQDRDEIDTLDAMLVPPIPPMQTRRDKINYCDIPQ